MNNRFYLLFLLALLSSCANQVAPSGGQKDVKPPQIKASTPQNFSTQFSGNKIVLEFDEFVQLQNITQQLVITPSMEHFPKTTLKGKKLIVEFEDSLKKETTYTLNFGNSVVDLTEKNPLDSNVFVFSTGKVIDSLEFKGNIKSATDLVPSEGMTVMLYENNADSVPYKERPSYFTKTDKEGKFAFSHLKSGSYKLFALGDENSSFLYDLPEEKIAFCDTLITLPTSASVSLFSFVEKGAKQEVIKATFMQPYLALVVLKNPVKQLQCSPLNIQNKRAMFIQEILTNRDSIYLWMQPTEENFDSLMFLLQDESWSDTITLYPFSKDKKTVVSPKPVLKVNAKNGELSPFQNLIIAATNPIVSVDKSKVILKSKKEETIILSHNADSLPRKIQVDFVSTENMEYEMQILPGAFINMYAQTNDSALFKFKTTAKNAFADLTLALDFPAYSGKYIIQLLDNKGVLIQEKMVIGKEKLDFKHLSPNEYKLKVADDANSNGQWDTGNYLTGVFPEKILFYSGKIEVKGGWDIQLNWKLE